MSRKDLFAYETFYESPYPDGLQLTNRIVRDPTITEELLQETFWQVWQKAGQYGEKGAVAAWLHRIARNKAWINYAMKHNPRGDG